MRGRMPASARWNLRRRSEIRKFQPEIWIFCYQKAVAVLFSSAFRRSVFPLKVQPSGNYIPTAVGAHVLKGTDIKAFDNC
jgi:hypothetical protein